MGDEGPEPIPEGEVLDMARRLGRAIRASVASRRLLDADRAVSEDPAARDIAKAMEEKRKVIDRANRQGRGVPREDAAIFASLQKELRENAKLAHLMKVQAAYTELLNLVNQEIQKELGGR